MVTDAEIPAIAEELVITALGEVVDPGLLRDVDGKLKRDANLMEEFEIDSLGMIDVLSILEQRVRRGIGRAIFRERGIRQPGLDLLEADFLSGQSAVLPDMTIGWLVEETEAVLMGLIRTAEERNAAGEASRRLRETQAT
jgi:hypothetical protein